MPETLHEILPKVFLKALSEEMLEVMVEVLYDILPEVLPKVMSKIVPKVRVIENYDLTNMTSGIFILIVIRHLSKQILIFVNIGHIPDIL